MSCLVNCICGQKIITLVYPTEVGCILVLFMCLVLCTSLFCRAPLLLAYLFFTCISDSQFLKNSIHKTSQASMCFLIRNIYNFLLLLDMPFKIL